jgi:hypothetical protein
MKLKTEQAVLWNYNTLDSGVASKKTIVFTFSCSASYLYHVLKYSRDISHVNAEIKTNVSDIPSVSIIRVMW